MPEPVRYLGHRPDGAHAEVLRLRGGDTEALDPRLDIIDHSPTGVEWGYRGSGPAQLALAILADYYDEDTAKRLYRAFMREVVAHFEEVGFSLRGEYVEEWVEESGEKSTPF